MPSFLPPETGGDYELPPEGNHVAVCYRVIDLGTQEVVWQGDVKYQRKILIAWELPEEKMKDGRPFSVQRRYTWSMSEKANLRHDLEAWRAKPFTSADFGRGGFNVKLILGKACMLQIMHEERNGKTYANIKAVASLPKGVRPPLAENPLLFFDLDEFDEEAFNALSEGLKGVIAKSPEYLEATKMPHENGRPDAELEDEIPF
jgi:hypothetical protein